ncbi:Major Facilitator Superfamily (MFS) [Thraustotheca clavata]|uniref:Hexose transporter 1 n=1 Tax=Thraustotheca clavata TaxID=74557 RepID=A0A1W0A6P8_9STRA|nr:Major Facilitator Superfamily (MFS) [Thraustotheca clavata]
MQSAFRNNKYAVGVCAFSSLGGIFFGYDNGVAGGVMVMPSFLSDFCIGYGGNTLDACNAASANLPTNWLNFTTLYNVFYYIGCMFGAVAGGYTADKHGRRLTIFSAALFYAVGAVVLLSSGHGQHTQVFIARIIQGFGVGNATFSLPVFAAEMAPKELRGMLSGLMQMACVIGIMLAGIINAAIQDVSQGWRITVGCGLIFPIVVMAGIFFVPESPRWTYKARGRDSASVQLKKLRKSDNITQELNAIGNVLEEEGSTKASWMDLWTDSSIRRRLLIAMGLQVLQQATGVNAVFAYGGQIFKDVLGLGIICLLMIQIVNFVSTIPAMYWVDHYGRRRLLLIGGVGMVIGHLVSAISFTAGCSGNTVSLGCSKEAGWVMVVFTMVFIFSFAISWGPICWIYPAEIFPMNIRAKAVSISTTTNWAMGALMIGIPKLFPYLNINGVFFLFCSLCGIGTAFVYFKCPETKGLLLEDIEHLFQRPGDHYVQGPKTPRDSV